MQAASFMGQLEEDHRVPLSFWDSQGCSLYKLLARGLHTSSYDILPGHSVEGFLSNDMQPLPVSIRSLEKNSSENDIKAVTTILHDAFSNDSFTNCLVAGHKELLYEMKLSYVKAGLIGGKVFVAEEASGAAVGTTIWFGPGEEFLNSEEQRSAGFNKFMESLIEKEPDMLSWWMNYFLPSYAEFTTRAFGSTEYKFNAWHLQFIGVLPSHQHQGVGKALIKHMEGIIVDTQDAKREPRRMCLETETEGALAFYKACGFVDKGLAQFTSTEKMKETISMWCVAKELL